MTNLCLKCGAGLSSPWAFCPHCGTAATFHPSGPAATPETEKTPVKHAYSGLLFGLVVAPMCVIVGGMLCLTGLGAFLGIPVIVAGLLAPLLGPVLAMGELKGACPGCGAELTNIVNSPGFACHHCGERVVVRDQRFVKAV